ncbi:YchJ family protein [Solimonas variicoloris]|uniref:YchJ family protein n=1 Tax=Solimonas variicoloris TaxID=254408 RepID=UPI0005847849|nr:YchJ family protein [Solimonas variicoloris]
MTKSSRSLADEACPCGSGLPYARCCAPLHAGVPAAHAEALMRSRYSAYVLGRVDYLLASWDAATRPSAAELTLDPATRWLGLKIVRHEADGDEALVEFVARSRSGGASAQRLHEISRFVRREGRWFYVDGTFPQA